MSETILTNAQIVLPDEVILGSVLIRNGEIVEIGTSTAAGEDMGGDYLMPGFVELHTDALEFHYKPRPRVRWSPASAIQQHDAQVAASGITTVFDALRVGLDQEADMGPDDMMALGQAISDATTRNRLRIDHFIHLRCEVSAPDCLDGFRMLEDHPQVRLASLMDHAPGQRQFQSIDQARVYYQGKLKMSDADFAAFIERRGAESRTYAPPHRVAIAQSCRERGISMASHDDATVAHVEEAIAAGIDVAEFPTTMEAARASHEAGLAVLMGAPNVVRGGSHSGNISARSLVDDGVLDILSSDYIPFSLMQAVFALTRGEESAISLPRAVCLVSASPAEAAGLADRGTITPGKRADLVRVEVIDEHPVVRTVWSEGERVI
jgi:alpha-D-ribose 1-methylphosphonate 5-triphosphate diphosphatase